MTFDELNDFKKRINNAISNGKGIDHKLHLMGEVDTIVAEYKELKKQLSELICAIYEHANEGTELMEIAERIDELSP